MATSWKADIKENELDVMPTKALFVDMLTRDIPIDRAVIDLIDNSVDGARKLRGDNHLDELEVVVDLNKDKFTISDNCGGISIEHARTFAFRFGRPKGVIETPGSVGQFGVGMKRALFKFGKYFEVESKTETERFKLIVNVDNWKSDDTPWTFEFAETEKALDIPASETGTTILVNCLHENVSAAFGDRRFQFSLARQIEAAQQTYIDLGLRIVFDGRTLITTPWSLLGGSELHPAFIEESIAADGKEPIHVRIYAGISKSDPKSSGWYVVCNGRMLLEADQSSATGWSDLSLSNQLCNRVHHSAASGTRSSPNINWKLCSAGFQ